ncbi:hypothetical protein SDC9_58671 [bioreactor metagenome]|uniref:Uncharacterized protein n=1 Tax=bioreactor metagenome TaxID=1076179 RepID=A0A644X8C2_9ZZZZ
MFFCAEFNRFNKSIQNADKFSKRSCRGCDRMETDCHICCPNDLKRKNKSKERNNEKHLEETACAGLHRLHGDGSACGMRADSRSRRGNGTGNNRTRRGSHGSRTRSRGRLRHLRHRLHCVSGRRSRRDSARSRRVPRAVSQRDRRGSSVCRKHGRRVQRIPDPACRRQ